MKNRTRGTGYVFLVILTASFVVSVMVYAEVELTMAKEDAMNISNQVVVFGFFIAGVVAALYHLWPHIADALREHEDDVSMVEAINDPNVLNDGQPGLIEKVVERYDAAQRWKELKLGEAAKQKPEPKKNGPGQERRLDSLAPAVPTPQGTKSKPISPAGEVWLGQSADGKIAKMDTRTNLLINGMTGYGKSTMIKAIVGQNLRNGVDVHVVDPSKFVDFAAFSGRILKIDTSIQFSEDPGGMRRSKLESAKTTLAYLRSLIGDMGRREGLMARAGVDDWSKVPIKKGGGPKVLVIFDEFEKTLIASEVDQDIQKETQEILRTLMWNCRKYGINILLMLHYPIASILDRQITTQCRSLTFKQKDESAGRACGYPQALTLDVGEFWYEGIVYKGWMFSDSELSRMVVDVPDGYGEPLRSKVKISDIVEDEVDDDDLLDTAHLQHSASTVPAHLPLSYSTPVAQPQHKASTQSATPVLSDEQMAMRVFQGVTSGSYAKKDSTTEPLLPHEGEAAKMLYNAGWKKNQIVLAFYNNYNSVSLGHVNRHLAEGGGDD